MFGRKQSEEGGDDDKKPANVVEAVPPLALKQRTQAQAAGQVAPAGKAPLSHPETIRRQADAATGRRTEGTESKMLIVGREITLAGEITACDRLVVEGRVEAKLNDCREIEIASTGSFAGAANIDIADVSGTFDGSLTAREYLIIRSTGRVTGTVRFRQLEVERGGQVCGDVQVLDGSNSGAVGTLNVDQKAR